MQFLSWTQRLRFIIYLWFKLQLNQSCLDLWGLKWISQKLKQIIRQKEFWKQYKSKNLLKALWQFLLCKRKRFYFFTYYPTNIVFIFLSVHAHEKINYTTQLSTQSQLQVLSQNCYISTSPEDVAKQLPNWVHLPLDQTQLHWDLMVEEVCETYWRQTVEQTEHSLTIAWNENHWKKPTVNDFLSNPGKTSKIK